MRRGNALPCHRTLVLPVLSFSSSVYPDFCVFFVTPAGLTHLCQFNASTCAHHTQRTSASESESCGPAPLFPSFGSFVSSCLACRSCAVRRGQTAVLWWALSRSGPH